MIIKLTTSLKTVLLFTTAAALFACNKSFPDTPGGDQGGAGEASNVTPKVLMIVVDGAVGPQVNAVNPPFLNAMIDYSIYSWDALSDYDNVAETNPLTWSTLLTGVKAKKHNVTGTDFTGNQFANYPSLFTRLKNERPGFRTAAFCSSNEVANNLAGDATEKSSFNGNDEATKEAVKKELSTQDASLVLAQFHDVDIAGSTTSYNAASSAYKNAILQTDRHIGEIVAAIAKRPTVKNENWMIIITSNKGSNTGYTPTGNWSAFDDSRHTTFFFCVNPRFNSQNPVKPGAIVPYAATAPLYNGTLALNRRAKALTAGNLYDVGATGDFTVQCKVKIPTGTYNYPPVLSKRAQFTAGVVGWTIFLEGNYWQFNVGQTSLANKQIRGNAVSDGLWHTITVVVKQEGAARNVYTYTDGILYTTGITNRDIASYGNLNSPAPLNVGNLSPDNVTGLKDYNVTDIRIYNTALPDSYIGSTYCATSVEPTNPYYNNLLGFWPGTSPVIVNGNYSLADMSGKNNYLTLDSYNPGSFNDLTTSVCPPITEANYKSVPNSVDVAVQIYLWLGINVPASWGLDGRNWVPTYSDVKGE